MTPIEIARKLAEYHQTEDAQKAYTLVLQQQDRTPEEEMEAASYLFFSQGDYQVAYTTFVSLYNRGYFQAELMDLMTQAFYQPNVKEQQRRYQDNCERLSRYPYFFRQDFPDFDQLPILFFPYDDNGYIPFDREKNRFGAYVDFNDPVIDRYFFQDLDKPVLAEDVYSQYQLEYLNDTVRKSEWVARENHIYLHYTDWIRFCAHLQCLSFRGLLREEKFVFLMENEVEQYPIDFQARFGIDYSNYPVRPVGIREVNRLIWHSQLSAHNGGDFFNEIFYGHPNLLSYESVMFDRIKQNIANLRKELKHTKSYETYVLTQLSQLKHPTDKDILVAMYLSNEHGKEGLDPNARIVPAIFFQPHFHNIKYQIRVDPRTNKTVLHSEQYEQIVRSSLFRQFKYVKTVTPMRRFTTSYAATVRYMANHGFKAQPRIEEEDGLVVVPDVITEYILNRSFMVARSERLFRDSVVVRFEDGKLNPKATFTALAAFLDIPYTQSMTYCSGPSGVDPLSMPGNARGFDPAPVYRTYDEYANDAERAYLEYFLRDAYERYQYEFHYYQGEAVDKTWVKEKISGFDVLNNQIANSWLEGIRNLKDPETKKNLEAQEKDVEKFVAMRIARFVTNRQYIADLLMRNLRFVDQSGQPLYFMKKLELDPAQLEQPLYH